MTEIPHIPRPTIAAIPEILASRIVGQPEIIPIVAEDAQNALLGLSDPRKPWGTYLALGPTGTGKTELAKTLTYKIFGDPSADKDHFIRFDMSEYQTQDALGLLLGSRSTERGKFGLFYDKAKGHGTLLFDEIEKAHPRIIDIFLQIMDEGRIGLANGEVLNLAPFFIFATSNVGAKAILNARNSDRQTVVNFVTRLARSELRPEIVARMKVLVYNALPFEHQLKAGGILLKEEVSRQERIHGISLDYDQTIVEFVVNEGFDPRMGMRPVRDVISRRIRAALRPFFLNDSKPSGRLIVDRATRSILLQPAQIAA